MDGPLHHKLRPTQLETDSARARTGQQVTNHSASESSPRVLQTRPSPGRTGTQTVAARPSTMAIA
eukprot:2807222-Rhodomonas_salina.1